MRRALCLQHGQTALLARVCTPSSPVRERKREIEREREKERGRKRGEREKKKIILIGMTGALAPFSYEYYRNYDSCAEDETELVRI